MKPCRVGTSGYFYRGWKGVFYPEDLPLSRYFEHYQRVFDTVELNASFYRFPTPGAVRRWYREAGAGFLYAVKVHREITHLRKFADPARVRDFYEAVSGLGEKLGPVLFQLPPRFAYRPEHLERVLAVLDPDFKNAIEFRHPSWWREEVYAALRAAGVAFVAVSAPGLPEERVATAFVYLRFHGRSAWYRYDYSREELAPWADFARGREAYAYFNNTDAGHAPANALTFRELLCR